MNHTSNRQWYAVRVMYRRELYVKGYLDELGITNYIPMRYTETPAGKGKENQKRKLVPAVHNLLFAHTERNIIDTVKLDIEDRWPIRLVIDPGTRQPVMIPEKQMHDFIAVTGSYDDHLLYLDNSAIELKAGDRIRITSGPFAGVEGELMRIKGDRRMVVRLCGILAVATAFIHPSLIERLETPQV